MRLCSSVSYAGLFVILQRHVDSGELQEWVPRTRLGKLAYHSHQRTHQMASYGLLKPVSLSTEPEE